MKPALRHGLLGLVALVGFGSAPPAPATAGPDDLRVAAEFEDGAQAPAHGWSQDDGCPARTGASAAQPLRGPLERAWKVVAAEGAIEGEPLAWKDRVFVVERAPKRRLLRVLSAATGAERSRLGVESSVTLAPTVGEGRVLLRTSPTAVEGLSVGETALTRRWKITAKEGIGAPTLLRDEVYVVRDGVLERWAYGSSAPTWPRSPEGPDATKIEPGPVPAGAEAGSRRYPRPSLRGASVFVTSGRELVEVDRATGAPRARASFDEDVDPETSRVVVATGDVFVRRGGAAPAAAGAVDAFRFTRYSGALEARMGLSLPAGFATAGPAWIGVVDSGGVRRLSGGRTGASDGEDLFVLAGEGNHDEFVSAAPPTFVPGAVYVGLRAFAFPSLTVLRSSAAPVVSRAIPLRDRLLVVENATTLSAWREARRGDDGLTLRPPGTGAVALKGRAALDDGRVLEGPFSFDPKANVFRSTKPGELPSSPARAVQAVLTSDSPRRLVLASGPSDAAAGVSAILRAETAKAILALVAPAAATGDLDLARRALGSAVEHGASDADVAAAEAPVAALEAHPAPRDEAKAADVEARLAALAHGEADVLLEVAGTLPKEAPGDFAVALVRAALEREPNHEGVARWVRARLPKELHPAEPLRLDDWLDFVQVRGRLAVHVWGVDKDTRRPWGSDGEVPSEDSDLFRNFWTAHSTWPGEVEVVAFECGPLVVFSTLERPGAIVRCLALGRLVSDTLDKTFAPMGPPKTDSEKLILHLFSTRQQYLEQTKPWGEAERSDGLENTAGHYSPGHNVTRMFFPDDSEDAFSVPGVYSHELTHHWVERRRPTAAGEVGDRSSSSPGYWVVEGFADFVRGFVFDVDGRRASAENPRAEYVDTISSIATEGLIPWSTYFTLTQEQFHKLSISARVAVPRRWRLGPAGSTVPMVLFYDQGAAVCGYLYLAENQKYRKALLDFLYAYYGGTAKADTLQRLTGLTADDLGKRVVAWCRELTKKG